MVADVKVDMFRLDMFAERLVMVGTTGNDTGHWSLMADGRQNERALRKAEVEAWTGAAGLYSNARTATSPGDKLGAGAQHGELVLAVISSAMQSPRLNPLRNAQRQRGWRCR